jgi:hypothetical protein
MNVYDKSQMSGLYIGQDVGQGNYNAKQVIEDFMKSDYQEGFRNEFVKLDALINKLPKDTITGKKKYKSFKLGISDNIRAVGKGAFDTYELGLKDFSGRGGETVEAEFDTTKLMATFAITDEAILKGTGDGSLIDVLHDQLNDMEVGMKHTMNRYTYGSYTGKIGDLDATKNGNKVIDVVSVASVTAGSQDISDKALDVGRDNRGQYHNMYRYGKAPTVVSFAMTNSHSLIAGMGALIHYQASTDPAAGDLRLVGYIWQKDNTDIGSEKILFIVEAVYKLTSSSGSLVWVKQDAFTDVVAKSSGTGVVYSRQLDESGAIAREYTGLEDIVVTQNNFLFGVDRSIYRSLNCTAKDLGGNHFLNEELLRDMTDHLAVTSPEGTSITLCCANHRIISQVEKALYQFKNYNLVDVAKGMQLGGGSELRFDNYVLHKDAFARDNNVYLLDQNKIGELVRRDFTWITSGEVNSVLQRRPGTELYEGIMNKYADMYIDAFRCHAVIKHCKVTEPGSYFSYETNGLPKGIGAPVDVNIASVGSDVVVKTDEQE